MWDILIQNLPLAILLVLAIIICGADLIKAIKVWKEHKDEKINKQIESCNKETELINTLTSLQNKLNDIEEKLTNQNERFTSIETRLDDLTESDMHDIKSWIVDQYHKFYNEQGYIDAFSADTIEHRYNDYKKEGGNSYIDTLMDRLHSLPMDAPADNNRE